MKVSEAVPELVNVMVCEADAAPTFVGVKVRLVGEMETETVGGAVPVPLRATVCGELATLSAMLRVAVSVPVVAGLKLTITAQDALTARVAPQVLAWAKEEAFVPPMVMPERLSVAVPALVSVTVCAAEVALVVVVKVRLVDERLTAGAGVVEGQAFTTLATLSDPRPVALS